MKATEIPEDAVGIWYLGQEAFLLKKEGRYLLIDPYLTDYVDRYPEFEKGFWTRNYPSPVEPEEMAFVQDILCTHSHFDHMDPDTLRGIYSARKEVNFIVPFPTIPILQELGMSCKHILGAKAGEPLEREGIDIIPVAAAHTQFHQDELGNYEELSYIIRWNGITVFHGGDMVVYPGLPELLREFKVDVAMIPINGGDWLRDSRDIIGNTDFREAADLGTAIGADLIIPMHYDLYSVNEENPAFFVDYLHRRYPGQKYHLFQPGERMIYFKERTTDEK